MKVTNALQTPKSSDDADQTVSAENENADIVDADSSRKTTWRIGTLVYTRSGLAVLFAWLLSGDFAWQLRERVVGPVAQLLLKHLQASDTFVGLLVGSIPSAMGLFFGPVVSTLSDRHRGPRGRRIPFLLAPTPFAAAALIGLGYSSQIAHGLAAIPAFHLSEGQANLIIFAAMWTIFEVAAVTTSGIFYALINDVVPHELVGRSFGAFRAVSLLAGILFNHFVIGTAEKHFTLLFVSVGLIYGFGVTLMCLKVREGKYPPPEPMKPMTKRDWIGPVKSYFRQTFSNPYYCWIYIATTLAMVAAGPVNSFSLFYSKSIHMSTKSYGDYLALTYIISFCASFALGWLADKIHPLRVSIGSIGLYAAATLAGGVFARTPGTFAVAFVAHGVLSGCLFTSIVPTYQRLFPKARFGEFYSAANLLQGLIFVALPASVGAFLDTTGHVYRYTFLISGTLATMGFIGLLGVYRNFKVHDGPKHYVAPE